MSASHYLSDEILNAYIDQELDEQEMIRVRALLAQNPGLQRRLNVLQQLKSMVYAAKPVVVAPLSQNNIITRKINRCRAGTAAAVLMIAGWLMWTLFPLEHNLSVNKVIAQGIEHTSASKLFDSALSHTTLKVVLHIKRNDKQAGETLFNQINTLLAESVRWQIAVRIEVLANGDGLALLRQDQSPYAQKVHDIRKRYDNVVFIACGDTIKRLNLSLADLKLFPEVMVVSSVKQQISLRQSQGWNVIQV